MIDVQEYEKRVIAHFKCGITEAEWELIGYCICERNDKHKVMTGESYIGERLSKFPEINSINIQATEHPIACLDNQLLNKEEIADLYMDEGERRVRINFVDKDSMIETMQELFDTQKCPYHLKACDALKKDDTWLVLALAQTDNENIAAYAQQLKYFENLCKSKNMNVRLIDDRPMGQCSCCDPIVADSYEELVKCLAAGESDES